jgi:hypothetical protein
MHFRRLLTSICLPLLTPIAAGLELGATGCVIPLAPEFEEEKNAAPELISVTPAAGTIVAKPDRGFNVTIEDLNQTDTLYVRWLIDYPPYDALTSRIDRSPDQAPVGAGMPNRHKLPTFTPSCLFHQISPTLDEHRLMLVVADRPFLDPESGMVSPDQKLDGTTEGAKVLRVFWTFELPCR